MTPSIRTTALTASLLLALGVALPASAAPFTYHGTLTDAGQPANGRYDLQVTLYGSEQAGAGLAPAITLYDVDVREGSFSTELELGTAAQNGGWIGVAVRPAGSGEFAGLSGREKLEPAGTCPASWLLDGNAGTNSGSNYIGTSDNQTLTIKANGRVAGRFQPTADGGTGFVAGSGRATATRSVSLNFGFADAVDSMAAGWGAIVDAGHDGTFAWGDPTETFHSGGQNQFLVNANGGFIINGNTVYSGTDDLVVYPRDSGDADTDLRLVSRNGSTGFMYIADATGIMTLAASNGVYITNPVSINGALDAKALAIEGSASKSTAGAWAANSDGRIKQDIEPVANALDTLQRLQPVSFRYTDAYRAHHAGIADQRYYNVIAQQFAEVFPDAVDGSGEYLPGMPKTPDNEILQVDTYPAQIVTIAAVQELARKNAALESSVERLMARIAKLESGRGK